MKHRDIQLIKKIIAECNDIIRYTNETGEQIFLENDVYQKATAMSLLNIGEHASILTRELWIEYNDIQWRKIVDLRNLVAHGYGELRLSLVWNLTQTEVPILRDQLECLLKQI